MKQRSTLAAALVAALCLLAGCGFFNKPVDHTDPGQVALYSGVSTAAFSGCLYAADKHPAEAAEAAKAIDQTVLPLINGGAASTTAIRDALIRSVTFDPRILTQAFMELDKLLKLVPSGDRDHVYIEALRNMAQGCRNGLAPPSAMERLWRWVSGEPPEAVS